MKKILRSIKTLPEKKHYLEFFTALLTVPVLITVILINFNSLKVTGNHTSVSPTPDLKQQNQNNPANTGKKVFNDTAIKNADPANTVPSDSASLTSGPCKQGVGSVSITSPEEGETVTENPADIMINYQADGYCAVVWSYRLNDGKWSDYDDKSIALYNLPQGKIKLDLKVKSIVSGEQKNLTRNFIYNNSSDQILPTLPPASDQENKTGSSSAN